MKYAEYIDYTNLKPDASIEDITKLCEEAKTYHTQSVCVSPYYVALAKELLEGTTTTVTTVIGFPLGASKTRVKEMEAIVALEDGADEIDMVINISALKNKDYDYVKEEIEDIMAAVDGKTLNCAVTVEAKKAADTASKNIVAQVENIAKRGEVTISITNNNTYPVDLAAKVEFYQRGSVVNTVEVTVSGLEPGKAWYSTYYNVLNNSFIQTEEAKVVVILASKSVYNASKLHASEIDVSQYETSIKGTVTAVNNAGKDIKEAVIAFVSYDDENKITKVERKVINDFKAGTSQTVETSASISPNSKVFVLYAHE